AHPGPRVVALDAHGCPLHSGMVKRPHSDTLAAASTGRYSARVDDDTRGQFEDLRRSLSVEFALIAARFDAVDRRFEVVDRRFDVVEARLEAADRRFDAVDEGLEAGSEQFRTIAQRFDAVDGRVDAVRRELGALIEDVRREVRTVAKMTVA